MSNPSLPAILIVDDEKDNLEALNRILRKTYAVTTTTSPFDALKLIQKQVFNVIVSDQRMPEMSGVELLEKTRGVSPNSTRILLTGYTDIDSVIGAINRGHIYRYVAKPWDPDDLALTLKQANEAFMLRDEIEQKNRSLEAKNTELNKALDELRQLDRAKAKFLALVSHELNTPLTAVGAFVSLLKEVKGELPKDLQKAVSSLGNASDRLSDIVAEVLTYVRLESENSVPLKALKIGAVLESAEKAVASHLAKKKLRMDLKVNGDLTVQGDADRLKVAFAKLLEDAATRSPEGKTLRVEVRELGGMAEVVILREGEKLNESAFSPLESGGEEKHHQKNLGLALSIAKTILERHGASIAVPAGKDAALLIRVPLSA